MNRSLQGMRMTGLGLALATLVTARAGAQFGDNETYKERLVQMMTVPKNVDSSRAWNESLFTAQRFNALVARAQTAETAQLLRVAADDFALASVIAPGVPQRDSAKLRLRTVMQRVVIADQGRMDAVRVDSLVAQALDHAFQQAYDHQFPVTRAVPHTSGRVVLAEYLTGVQCGICWVHDRAYAAVLQRYAPTDVVVLAYHGGVGYPIAPVRGVGLWRTIGSVAESPPSGLYRDTLPNGSERLGWVDGAPVGANSAALEKAPSEAAATYSVLTEAIDRRRSQSPGARIALTATPSGISDTGLSAARVDVRVTPLTARKRLGVRLVLVEDTVRVTGFTKRRLHYMAVRNVAWFGPDSSTNSLFFSLPAESTTPTKFSYTFDVATLQRHLLEMAEDEDAHAGFPDPATWHIQPRRLGIVAIVQDQDTKEVLQTAYQPLFPGGPGGR